MKMRVYAHHGDAPSGFLTPTLPTLPPPLPETVQPLAEYWVELSSQNLVDSPPGYDGPGYGPMGAVEPDQWRYDLGFGPAATNFTVSGLCVLLVGAAQADYNFVLISPTGNVFPVPADMGAEAMAPMPEWGDPTSPYTGLQLCWDLREVVESGLGVWRLQVFAAGSSAPVATTWANGISCVQLGETPEAGYLAVEFTGVEVMETTTTTTPPPTTTTTTTTPEPTTTTTTT
ncbi:MAG TPA: hypothetical protein VFC19_41845, partial [Candidatus Limnocylindrales bacterium]|nr:hypothetical protein [Candidatus Limnocylindrales bacterium]